MKTTYLVDGENVLAKGILGCGQLNKDDRLIVFISEHIGYKQKELILEETKKVKHTEIIHVDVNGKDALDFQLATYLGFLIQKGENDAFCIISRDTGFDNVVHFWESKGVLIKREDDLLTVTNTNPIAATLSDEPDHIVIAVYYIIQEFLDDGKNAVYQTLLKAFNYDKGVSLYQRVQPLL